MFFSAHQIPFLYFTKAKRRFVERVSQASDLFYRILLHNQ